MRHRGRPLLSDPRRTRAWPVLATCVIVLVALGLLLREQARPDGLDSVVDAAMVAGFRGHQDVLPWLALPGSTIPLIAVSAAIAAGCLIARRLNGAVLAVTAVPVTAFLDDTVLKHVVDRTHLGQLSFPSGHTASAMTLATVLGVLLHDPARRAPARLARAALVVVACGVTALVAVGVIGLRWHYFTDTVGGVALGTATVLTLAFLIDRAWVLSGRPLSPRRHAEPVAPARAYFVRGFVAVLHNDPARGESRPDHHEQARIQCDAGALGGTGLAASSRPSLVAAAWASFPRPRLAQWRSQSSPKTGRTSGT